MGSRAPLLLASTLAALLAAGSRAGAQPDAPPVVGPPLGTPTVLTVDPTIPALVYAGFADVGLFRSTDGGTTWERFAAGLPGVDVVDLTVDPFNPGILYVLEAGHGLFKSQNGGLSWTSAGVGLEPPAEVRGVVADPDDRRRRRASRRHRPGHFPTARLRSALAAAHRGAGAGARRRSLRSRGGLHRRRGRPGDAHPRGVPPPAPSLERPARPGGPSSSTVPARSSAATSRPKNGGSTPARRRTSRSASSSGR